MIKRLARNKLRSIVDEGVNNIYRELQREMGVDSGDVAGLFHSGTAIDAQAIEHFTKYCEFEYSNDRVEYDPAVVSAAIAFIGGQMGCDAHYPYIAGWAREFIELKDPKITLQEFAFGKLGLNWESHKKDFLGDSYKGENINDLHTIRNADRDSKRGQSGTGAKSEVRKADKPTKPMTFDQFQATREWHQDLIMACQSSDASGPGFCYLGCYCIEYIEKRAEGEFSVIIENKEPCGTLLFCEEELWKWYQCYNNN